MTQEFNIKEMLDAVAEAEQDFREMESHLGILQCVLGVALQRLGGSIDVSWNEVQQVQSNFVMQFRKELNTQTVKISLLPIHAGSANKH